MDLISKGTNLPIDLIISNQDAEPIAVDFFDYGNSSDKQRKASLRIRWKFTDPRRQLLQSDLVAGIDGVFSFQEKRLYPTGLGH